MEKQKFRIASDLHSEFWRGENLWPELLPPLDSDKDSILLLAGDIGTKRTLNQDWFEEVVSRFHHFCYVEGNHEFYGSSVYDAEEPEIIIEDGRNILGVTLWTDMDTANPVTMQLARNGMNDYRAVRDNTPEYTVELNGKHVAFLYDYLKESDVVVTHHAPSYKSLTPGFEGSMLNPAFLNNLDGFILDRKPALWVHGHVHSSHDYFIGDTRVVCNPYGYFMHEVNKDYNPALVVEC